MSAMASQTTGASIVYLTVCSDVDQRKHQSSVSLAFVRQIHRWPVNSQDKGPVTRKMLPFDDVIMAVNQHRGRSSTYWSPKCLNLTLKSDKWESFKAFCVATLGHLNTFGVTYNDVLQNVFNGILLLLNVAICVSKLCSSLVGTKPLSEPILEHS